MNKPEGVDLIDVCGLESDDITELLAEIAMSTVIAKSSGEGPLYVIEEMINHSMKMRGNEARRRMMLIHLLAYVQSQILAGEFVKTVVMKKEKDGDGHETLQTDNG